MSLRRVIGLLLTMLGLVQTFLLGEHGYGLMAVVLIEGFDHWSTAAQSAQKGWGSTWAPSTNGLGVGPRFGTGKYMFMNNGTQTAKVLPSTYTTLIVGFAYYTTVVSAGQFLAITDAAAGTTIATLNWSSGKVQVKNSAGTTIATGTATITVNTWHYYEVKIFVNTGTPASGTCEVHIDGVSDIASTAGNFGSTAMGRISIGGINSTIAYDDLYVLDTTGSAPRNTFLGDVRVDTKFADGVGNKSQWTKSGGTNNYDRVNETSPDDDTGYVSDSTPGDIDTYTFQDVDGGATVYGVQVNIWARKDDAGTRQIAPVIRQSGTDNVGTTVTLSTTYTYYSQIYNQDPTASDWTATNVNADEYGVKEIA